MLPKYLKKIIRQTFHKSYWGEARRVVGVPADIGVEELDELCVERTGSHVKTISYAHLSGWKRAGASRIYIENERGNCFSTIYKNAIYSYDHIPALKFYPFFPGKAEYLIYGRANEKLSAYLPEVYMLRECKKNQHFQYLLEDLGGEYVSVASKRNKKEKISVVESFPQMHKALKEFLYEVGGDGFLNYNGRHFSLLLEQFEEIVARFEKASDSAAVREVNLLWPELAALLKTPEYASLPKGSLVHGDANGSNILVNKRNPKQLKMLDWEWAGIGMEMIDVVSLFRRADQKTCDSVLKAYWEATEMVGSYSEMMRQFLWCRLERGMMDAAYVAAQYMGSRELMSRRERWANQFVDKSLQSVVSAYRLLR